MSRRGQTITVKVSSAIAMGAGRPIGWEGGVKFTSDEPVQEVLAALDATLAQVRSQLEIDIREICR